MNFEKLFKREFSTLGGLISTLVPDRDAIEIILREAYAKLWDKRDIVVKEPEIHDFLENAALSGAVRYMVDNRKATGAKAETGNLESVITTLPTHARAVFVLARESQLKFSEIGEMLDLSPETVTKQLGKALRLIYTGMTGEKMPVMGYNLKSWAKLCETIGKHLAGEANTGPGKISEELLHEFQSWWKTAGNNRPVFEANAAEQWELFLEVVPEAKGGKIVDKAAQRRRKKLIRKWGLRLIMLAIATGIALWIVL